MAIDLNFDSGAVQEGESKRLEIELFTTNNSVFTTPSTLVAEFLSPKDKDGNDLGTDGSYTKPDFNQKGDTYWINHTFDAPGAWLVKVSATDLLDNKEIEWETVDVQPQPQQ